MDNFDSQKADHGVNMTFLYFLNKPGCKTVSMTSEELSTVLGSAIPHIHTVSPSPRTPVREL